MNPKLVLVLAVIAGILAVFMVQRHVDNLRGETVSIFKATADQKAGEALGSDIEEISIPAGLFPKLFDEAPTGELIDFVSTTPLRHAVETGDILLFRHFDSSIDQGIRPEIPAGMKALSISVNQDSAVSFFIQPGDIVDVMGTFSGNEKSSGPQTNEILADVSTRPILQAVSVLAVGNQYRKSSRQLMEPYSSVTLLVSMEEAAKLIFAQDFFNVRMTLILRGENDFEVDQKLTRVGVETLEFDKIGNDPMTQKEQ